MIRDEINLGKIQKKNVKIKKEMFTKKKIMKI